MASNRLHVFGRETCCSAGVTHAGIVSLLISLPRFALLRRLGSSTTLRQYKGNIRSHGEWYMISSS